MSKYPSFIPPTSGYIDYKFNDNTHHLGLYDYMTWDKLNKQPLSIYHPYYLHSINDSIYSQRQQANAASIELGVGKHISDIARYANSFNLGYSDKRIGVAYFKNIGVSGSPTWWTESDILSNISINSGLVSNIINTNYVSLVSGIIDSNSTFNITSNNLNLFLNNTIVDKIVSINDTWYIDNGYIITRNNINLFDGSFILNNNSSGNITGDVTFNNLLYVRNLYTLSNSVSGFFESYNKEGISDYSIINYDSDGHDHESLGWSKPEITNHNIIGPILYDNGVFYAIGDNELFSLADNTSNENWSSIRSYEYQNFNAFSSIYKKNQYYDISNDDKIGYLNNNEVKGILNDNKLILNNTEHYNLKYKIKNNDFLFVIKNKLYYIQSELDIVVVYVYNGKKWSLYTSKLGNIINVVLYKSELIIITNLLNRVLITRFTLLNQFKTISFINNLTNYKDITVYDHIIYVLFDNTVKCYSITNTSTNHTILNVRDTDTNKLSVYSNANYIYVQAGYIRVKILKDVSNSLSFESINGIYKSNNNIYLKSSINTKSVINALTKYSLYTDLLDISTDTYTLNPNNTSYITRYLYNKEISDSMLYNDITSTTIFNNSYYFGHRGDISIFNRLNDAFTAPVTTKIDGKICVKFLPLNDSLFALMQDFTDAETDYLNILPISPKAIDSNTDYIPPYVPIEWSVPFTKLYYKNGESNKWEEYKQTTNLFGRRLIDAISHDNNIYVIAHDINGSGIISYKIEPNKDSQIPLTFSGVLQLNEALNNETDFTEYYPNYDGTYKISDEYLKQEENSIVYDNINNPTTTGQLSVYQNGYPVKLSNNINGHHEFYMYNHPKGPYVVHDQVEVLYDTIIPSSILPIMQSLYKPVEGYIVNNNGKKYSYRTISISFLSNELDRPTRIRNIYDTPIPLEKTDINNPTIKIPIDKDHPDELTDDIINNKYLMKNRFDDVNNAREDIHFITSITYNKSIYLLVQIKSKLRIYAIRDFNDYVYKIPFDSNILQPNPKQTMIYGNTSYAGIKTNTSYSYGSFYNAFTDENIPLPIGFFLDFIPFDTSNTLVAEIDITNIIKEKFSNIYILGDGDDLYIKKSFTKDYRKNKRYATQSNFKIGGNLYLPLTLRVNHPTGELYSFVLGFFNDGSIGFIQNEESYIGLIKNPMGRVQCISKDGRYVISGIKMLDGQNNTISYEDIKENPAYGELSLPNLKNISSVYNSYAKKQWFIGEYDIKIEDSLNFRENY